MLPEKLIGLHNRSAKKMVAVYAGSEFVGSFQVVLHLILVYCKNNDLRSLDVILPFDPAYRIEHITA